LKRGQKWGRKILSNKAPRKKSRPTGKHWKASLGKGQKPGNGL